MVYFTIQTLDVLLYIRLFILQPYYVRTLNTGYSTCETHKYIVQEKPHDQQKDSLMIYFIDVYDKRKSVFIQTSIINLI